RGTVEEGRRTMRHVAAFLIRVYQWTVSPLLGPACRFYPSCSQYAVQALLRFGVVKGGWLALARLSRCHPWHPRGFDPVPPAPPARRQARPPRRRACTCARTCSTSTSARVAARSRGWICPPIRR